MDEDPGRPWHVFATYAAAVAGIFATTWFAIDTLHTMYPDVPEATLLGTLPASWPEVSPRRPDWS